MAYPKLSTSHNRLITVIGGLGVAATMTGVTVTGFVVVNSTSVCLGESALSWVWKVTHLLGVWFFLIFLGVPSTALFLCGVALGNLVNGDVLGLLGHLILYLSQNFIVTDFGKLILFPFKLTLTFFQFISIISQI